MTGVARTSEVQWQAHSLWYHPVRTGADAQMGADDPLGWKLAPGELCAMGYALRAAELHVQLRKKRRDVR